MAAACLCHGLCAYAVDSEAHDATLFADDADAAALEHALRQTWNRSEGEGAAVGVGWWGVDVAWEKGARDRLLLLPHQLHRLLGDHARRAAAAQPAAQP